MEQVIHNKAEVNFLLGQKSFNGLKTALHLWLPEELAELITNYTEDNAEEVHAAIFKSIDREQSVKTFELLELSLQEELLSLLPARQMQLILNDMSPDNRTALLEELPAELLTKSLKLLTQKERTVALSLLGYPENSIGRLMTPDYIAVRKEWTVKYVLDYIREFGENSETLNIIYIVDDKGKLIDDIKVREILLAELDTKVSEIIDGKFVSLSVVPNIIEFLFGINQYRFPNFFLGNNRAGCSQT